MKKLSILGLLILAVTIISCGGTTGSSDVTGDVADVSTTSSTATGDFTPSLTTAAEDSGALKFTVSAMDVDGDGTLESPTITSVTATTGAGAALKKATSLDDEEITCDSGRTVGEGDDNDSFDIGISLDSTASMGSAVESIAEKIVSFAQTLEDSGVDARFAGITLGDAFATKSDNSSFTDAISSGPLGTPPSFDSSERPSTGSTVLTSADMQTFFQEVADVVGTGAGGADLPENYLGSLEYLNDSVSWRDGAARVLISIGDDCAHTPDTYQGAGITTDWIPPAGADLAAALAGVATVHVIGESSCSTSYYAMDGIADATGGSFTEFDCYSSTSCNVDLESLPITSAITEGRVYNCDGSEAVYGETGTYTLTIGFTVEASNGETYTATIVLVIVITFA